MPVEYDILHAEHSWHWDEVQPEGPEDVKVVMVTQLSVSRLPKFKHVVQQWGGPVSVAVYIEFPLDSAEAAVCRARVAEYVDGELRGPLEATGAAQPFVLSYLHAPRATPGSACSLPVPDWSRRRRRQRRALSQFVHAGLRASMRIGENRGGGAAVAAGGEAWRSSGAGRLGRLAHFAHGLEAQSLRGMGDEPNERQDMFKMTLAKQFWKMRPGQRQNFELTEEPWVDVYAAQYPVNALRNAAWRQVPAGAFVFLNDIDFIPDAGLYPDLISGRFRDTLARMRDEWHRSQVRRTLVLPAFERVQQRCPGPDPRNDCAVPYDDTCLGSGAPCHVLDGVKMPRTFEGLRQMLQARAVDVFHRRLFSPGHGCYSWLAWLQEEHPETMVPMEYLHPCEPYVIALSDALPRYDERFRGRGQNKVEHLTHMAMWGFEWALLPGHFLVHMPHNVSTGVQTNWDTHATPLALMRVKAAEIEREREFRRHVQLQVPLAEPQDKPPKP